MAQLSFAKSEALKSRAFTRETSFSNQMWSAVVSHGHQENAFQVNQLYNVTWSNIYVFFLFMSKDVATRKITKAKMIHDN